MSFSELQKDNVDDFVFATAANRHYFSFLKDTVASIQEFKPSHKIIVFDLGLDNVQVIKVIIVLKSFYITLKDTW